MTSGSVARNSGWSWSALVAEAKAEGLVGEAAEERALVRLQFQVGLGTFGQQYDLTGQLRGYEKKGGGMGTMTAHGAVSMNRGDGKREPGDRQADFGSVRLDIHDEIPSAVMKALPPESSVLDLIDRWDGQIAQGFMNPMQRIAWIYRRKLTQSSL